MSKAHIAVNMDKLYVAHKHRKKRNGEEIEYILMPLIER